MSTYLRSDSYKYKKYSVIGTILFLLGIIGFIMAFVGEHQKKIMNEESKFMSGMTECQQMDYKLSKNNAWGSYKRTLLLEKQNLILEGKCKD